MKLRICWAVGGLVALASGLAVAGGAAGEAERLGTSAGAAVRLAAAAQSESTEADVDEAEGGSPEGAEADNDDAHPGRTAYIEHNCSLCHAAYERGIGDPPEDGTDEDDDEGSGAEVPGGPGDLSALDERWTAELLRVYLVEREPVDGEKHVVGFRGEDDEWNTLVEWLLLPSARADSTDAARFRETESSKASGRGGTSGNSAPRSDESGEER